MALTLNSTLLLHTALALNSTQLLQTATLNERVFLQDSFALTLNSTLLLHTEGSNRNPIFKRLRPLAFLDGAELSQPLSISRIYTNESFILFDSFVRPSSTLNDLKISLGECSPISTNKPFTFFVFCFSHAE